MQEKINEVLEVLCEQIKNRKTSYKPFNAIRGVFNRNQQYEMIKGFQDGLPVEDVKLYAKAELDEYQMREVRKAITYRPLSEEEKALLINPEFTWAQMEQIRIGFFHGIDIEKIRTYALVDMDPDDMEVRRIALRVEMLAPEKENRGPSLDQMISDIKFVNDFLTQQEKSKKNIKDFDLQR